MATHRRGDVEVVPVLLYHAVDDVAPVAQGAITVSPRLFAAHLDVIADSGLDVVPLSSVARVLRDGSGGKAAGRAGGRVAITFDDGYRSVITHAAPELAERGFPATLFSTTGVIGGTFAGAAMLDESELRTLRSAGFEIGSHTVSHPHLDLIDRQQVERELRDSKSRLEDVLGCPVEGLAYPHGSHRRSTRRLAARTGFGWAAAVKNAFTHAGDDVWSIARITLGRHTTPSDLETLLRGDGAPLSWPGERFRTTVYRAVRRTRTRDGRDPALG